MKKTVACELVSVADAAAQAFLDKCVARQHGGREKGRADVGLGEVIETGVEFSRQLQSRVKVEGQEERHARGGRPARTVAVLLDGERLDPRLSYEPAEERGDVYERLHRRHGKTRPPRPLRSAMRRLA